jgi:hypothetical protein
MEWSNGDLVWFDPGLGHPLPGEIQEVHRAAQIIIVQALINGKVSFFFCFEIFNVKPIQERMCIAMFPISNLSLNERSLRAHVSLTVSHT